MKTLLVRSVLFTAVIALFIATSAIDTNLGSLKNNNNVPLPPHLPPLILDFKYVTPYGTGDHQGTSYSNAFSLEEMKTKLDAFTTFYLVDSVFDADNILISNLDNIEFTGLPLNGAGSPGKTILRGGEGIESLSFWKLNCFDLNNADNISIKNITIKNYRWFGVRVNSSFDYFFGYNIDTDSCGWTGIQFPPPPIISPCAIKLFGDKAQVIDCQILNSGWDGMQVAGYWTLVESTDIIATGQDLLGAVHQGDGIQLFKNQDIFYDVNGQRIYKSGRLTVRSCYINTIFAIKSGIEAGYIADNVEKPLVQIYDSYIAGGKGIGITQNANPLVYYFYSTIQNCTIEDLDATRNPIRIGKWDYSPSSPDAQIKHNICICPSDYSLLCPVGECDTPPGAVPYINNRWKIGDDWQSEWCSTNLSPCIAE